MTQLMSRCRYTALSTAAMEGDVTTITALVEVLNIPRMFSKCSLNVPCYVQTSSPLRTALSVSCELRLWVCSWLVGCACFENLYLV
jgi:hypothetical protein